jgi:ficolin
MPFIVSFRLYCEFIGNKYLHTLLSQGNYELRMDMEDFDGESKYVKYKSVSVGEETSKYRMNISGYSGDTGNDRI